MGSISSIISASSIFALSFSEITRTEDIVEGDTLSEYRDGILVGHIYHSLNHVTIGKNEFENHWVHKFIQTMKQQVREMRNLIA